MNCNQITPYIIDHIDGELDNLKHQAVLKHLQSCNRCRNKADYENLLQQSLQSLSTRNAPEGFCQNTFENINTKQRKKSIYWGGFSTAIAASLAILLTVTPLQENATPTASQSSPGIEMVVNNIENVRLSFIAPDDFKHVVFTVSLPPKFELSGFPGKRKLSWETSLLSGANVLNLPLIAKDIGEGVIEAKISNHEKSKTFKIKMVAKPQKQARILI